MAPRRGFWEACMDPMAAVAKGDLLGRIHRRAPARPLPRPPRPPHAAHHRMHKPIFGYRCQVPQKILNPKITGHAPVP